MYQLISAIAKPFVGDGHWVNVEIGNVPLHVLFSSYSRMWIVLSNTFLTAPVALDLEKIRAEHGGKTITFNQFLESLGNQALPTQVKIPKIAPRYAKYQDAFRAGYKIQAVHPTYSVDASVIDADKTWLYMTRPDLNYALFYKSCLVNINGFYHLTDTDGKAIYVVDGMESARIARENQIGFVSFASLGSIKQVPIKKEMLYKQFDEQEFKHQVYINLGQDVTNKTVMLVLGGYLHAVDKNSFRQVGEQTFMVDFGNLPFIERYFESRNYIDLSSLGLTKAARNDRQTSMKELYSDEAITAYMTLSQSFFVILDNPDVFAELAPLQMSHIPNMFITDETPIYPMITGVGRAANYWTKFDAGKWALYATDNLRDRPIHRTVNPAKLVSVTDQREPYKPVYEADAFFLKIGSDLA